MPHSPFPPESAAAGAARKPYAQPTIHVQVTLKCVDAPSLMKQAREYAEAQHMDAYDGFCGLRFELRFPGKFPASPPTVRLVGPMLRPNTGGVVGRFLATPLVGMPMHASHSSLMLCQVALS